MKRRDFVGLTGLAAGALFLPSFPSLGGTSVDPARLLEPGADVALKKRLADAGLNAAKAAGASYADVRIGRYLNQGIFTREKQVQNIASTESYGVGIRVIANGTWGFASTNSDYDVRFIYCRPAEFVPLPVSERGEPDRAPRRQLHR